MLLTSTIVEAATLYYSGGFSKASSLKYYATGTTSYATEAIAQWNGVSSKVKKTASNRIATATHELGHALSLRDNNNSVYVNAPIMSQGVKTSYKLTSAELISVRLYGKSLQDEMLTQSESKVENDNIDVMQCEDEEGNRYEFVESIGDCVEFSYEDLKNRADVIALVKVSDSLSQADANIIFDESGEYIFDYYQNRQVEVIKYYKNGDDNKKVMEVIEPCAVYQDQLLTLEGYNPLCKGQTYLLFLDYKEKKMYSLISAGTSVVPMESLQEAKNLDIAYKAILDFGESIIPAAEKKEILSQDKVKHNKSATGNNVVITIDDYTFHCNYLDSEEGCHLVVGK